MLRAHEPATERHVIKKYEGLEAYPLLTAPQSRRPVRVCERERNWDNTKLQCWRFYILKEFWETQV